MKKEIRILSEKRSFKLKRTTGYSRSFSFGTTIADCDGTLSNESQICEHIKQLLETGEWRPASPLPLDWSILNQGDYDIKIFMERIIPEQEPAQKAYDLEEAAKYAYLYHCTIHCHQAVFTHWEDLHEGDQKEWRTREFLGRNVYLRNNPQSSWENLSEEERHSYRLIAN